MPWGVRKQGSKFAIYRKDTGKVVGHSNSRQKAEASIRARYANSKEFSDYNRNMSKFVKSVANKVLTEKLEIEGKTYALVPEEIGSGLSGSIAMAFGVKKRDGKIWVPAERLEELKELDAEIREELKSSNMLQLDEQYKYESVLAKVPESVSSLLKTYQKLLQPEIIKELEDEPHITVIYGLEGQHADEIESVIDGLGPFSVVLGKIKLFEENEDFDVLVIEVDSDDICMAHLVIASEFAVMSTYPCYKPHMTIAYLKKGTGKQYVGDSKFEGVEFEVSELEYSTKSGNKSLIKV